MKPKPKPKPTIHAVAIEEQGLMRTMAYIRDGALTWAWLTAEQAQVLWRFTPQSRRYMIDDERLSTIATRYPRYVLGYADSPCGRRLKGGLALNAEDVLVDAVALDAFLFSLGKIAGAPWEFEATRRLVAIVADKARSRS